MTMGVLQVPGPGSWEIVAVNCCSVGVEAESQPVRQSVHRGCASVEADAIPMYSYKSRWPWQVPPPGQSASVPHGLHAFVPFWQIAWPHCPGLQQCVTLCDETLVTRRLGFTLTPPLTE